MNKLEKILTAGAVAVAAVIGGGVSYYLSRPSQKQMEMHMQGMDNRPMQMQGSKTNESSMMNHGMDQDYDNNDRSRRMRTYGCGSCCNE